MRESAESRETKWNEYLKKRDVKRRKFHWTWVLPSWRQTLFENFWLLFFSPEKKGSEALVSKDHNWRWKTTVLSTQLNRLWGGDSDIPIRKLKKSSAASKIQEDKKEFTTHFNSQQPALFLLSYPIRTESDPGVDVAHYGTRRLSLENPEFNAVTGRRA